MLAKILTIIPYSFYPPMNGGSLRCFYILREMAREHSIYLLTAQPVEDFCMKGVPALPINVNVVSLSDTKGYHSAFNILPKKLGDAINYRLLKKTFLQKTSHYFLNAYPILVKTLKEIKPDIVYYENLEALGFFSSVVRKHSPYAKQIYDAHNVDSELWKQLAIAQDNRVLNTYSASALQMEKKFYKMVDEVFCCSDKDYQKLMQLNNQRLKASIVPNGVDTSVKRFDTNEEKNKSKNILFCGSLEYFPNEEGLLWFYKIVFPLVKNRIPGIVLTLVGTVEQEKYGLLIDDPLVNFEGRVTDVEPFYRQASICIAPLLSGSGTRLKILEAMSFGNPIVSTAIGCEGITYENNKHLIVADEPGEFASSIISLLEDKDEFNYIRLNARKFVEEKYDWQKIGADIRQTLQRVLN